MLACTPFGTLCIPDANIMTLVTYIRNTLLEPRRHRMGLNGSYFSCVCVCVCVCLEMTMVEYASEGFCGRPVLSDALNTLRTGLLNFLSARSRGLTFRHRASCI